MPERFSWIIRERLAGMERPGLVHNLKEDLEFLKDMGIDVIVNLEEKEFLRSHNGFEIKHIPVGNFKAPRLEDIEEFVRFVECKIRDGKRIVVHCHAGMGRTNLMLATYLVYMGMKPDEALDIVREKRPYHAINEEQEEALREYFYITRPSGG